MIKLNLLVRKLLFVLMLSGLLPGVSCMHKDVKDTKVKEEKATGKKTEKGKIGTIQVIIIGACLCVVVWFIYDFKYSQKFWLWRKSPINLNSLSDAKDKTKRSNNIFHKNKVLNRNGASPSENADRNMNLNTDENMNAIQSSISSAKVSKEVKKMIGIYNYPQYYRPEAKTSEDVFARNKEINLINLKLYLLKESGVDLAGVNSWEKANTSRGFYNQEYDDYKLFVKEEAPGWWELFNSKRKARSNSAPPSKNADRDVNLNTDENMNTNGLRIGFLPCELQPL